MYNVILSFLQTDENGKIEFCQIEAIDSVYQKGLKQ